MGLEAFDFAKEYFMAFKQPEAKVEPLDVRVRFRWAKSGGEASFTGKRTQVPNPNVFEASVLLTAIFFQTGCQKQPSQSTIPKKYQQQLYFNKHHLISESESSQTKPLSFKTVILGGES